MLILKPAGRGNWATMEMRLDGPRSSPLLFQVGSLIELGGVLFRIMEKRA